MQDPYLLETLTVSARWNESSLFLSASGPPKPGARYKQQIVVLIPLKPGFVRVRCVRFRTSLCANGQARVSLRDVTWTAYNWFRKVNGWIATKRGRIVGYPQTMLLLAEHRTSAD